MSDEFIKMFDEINKIIETGKIRKGDKKANNELDKFIKEINQRTELKMSYSLTDQSTVYMSSELKDKLGIITNIDTTQEEGLKKAIKVRIEQIKDEIKDQKDQDFFDRNFKTNGETKKEEMINTIAEYIGNNETVSSASKAYKLLKDKIDAWNPVNYIWVHNDTDNPKVMRSILIEKGGKWKICIEKKIDKECSDIVNSVFRRYQENKAKANTQIKDYYDNNQSFLDGGHIYYLEKNDNCDLSMIDIENSSTTIIKNDETLVDCVSNALNNQKEEYKKMIQEIRLEEYKDKLEKSKNIIFRGAPGTGKTHLAKDLAAYIVSEGQIQQYDELKGEYKKYEERIGFVQFHPSYDYTDFVEGLRPIQKNGTSEIGFELKPGVFKKFCEDATDGKYVFIIDEINRGEISKILGELFFSIDPGYRGENGGVLTQYSNLHEDTSKKFYIPENVYIIGTMNDIDRSVDTFDFAMRRRFRFIEIKPEDTRDAILRELEDVSKVIDKMDGINKAIRENDDLGPNYQLGAAYFSKLKDLNYNYEELWNDYLEPLLADYLQGTDNAKTEMDKLEKIIIEKKKNTDVVNDDQPEDHEEEYGEGAKGEL